MARIIAPSLPGKLPWWRWLWKHPLASFLAYAVLPSLLIVAVVNLAVPEPNPKTIKDKARLAAIDPDHSQAKDIYWSLIQEDSTNLRYHQGYIYHHYSLPRYARSDAPTEIYSRYTRSTSDSIRDIGNYCLGLIASQKENWSQALQYCQKVGNRELPGLYKLIGYCSLKTNDTARAVSAFKQELENSVDQKSLKGAMSDLSELYVETHAYSELQSLANEPRYVPFLPRLAQEYLSLRKFDALGYIKAQFRYLQDKIPWAWPGILGSLLIVTLWSTYLILVGNSDLGQTAWLLLALGAGLLVSALIVHLVVDARLFLLGARKAGSWPGDLCYYLSIPGLVEESAKLGPALLIYRFGRRDAGQLDLLRYGCMSALGLALWESISKMRFPGTGLSIAVDLSNVFFHMAMTVIAASGLLRTRLPGRGPALFSLAKTFVAACLLHGLYDFFIGGIGPGKILWWVPWGIDILCIAALGLIMNETIGKSALARPDRIHWLRTLGISLGIGLCGVFIAQYVKCSFQFGPAVSTRLLFKAVVTYSVYIDAMIITGLLGDIRLPRRKAMAAMASPEVN